MPTLTERILGAPAGEYVDRPVDKAFAHDGTGVLTLEAWKKMKVAHLAHPERIYLIFDHIAPAHTSVSATLQHELRDFAQSHCIHFSDVGGGICHQFMAEGEVLPGEVVVGADSHTSTLGAFGAFATGVGATDMAAIWMTGSTWFRVPGSIAIRLSGRLEPPAEAKDLALTYTGVLGMDGAAFMALEFIGEGTSSLSIDDRLTVCNLSVETGAKNGIFYADELTRRYLAGFGKSVEIQHAETPGYVDKFEIDLGNIGPVVAVPPRVDNIRPVSELGGLQIDQVFIGTCTNGRYEDLARLAGILKGKKVAVRTIVVPASRSVLQKAIASGILADLVTAGCVIAPPGCGPCLGAHMGVLGEKEICVSTANRNFVNRMGVGGEVYLTSVATAAASALHGELTAPEAGCAD